jgi:hypothetical protein
MFEDMIIAKAIEEARRAPDNLDYRDALAVVRDGCLRRIAIGDLGMMLTEFVLDQLPRTGALVGQQGPPGPQGPAGPTGPVGAASFVTFTLSGGVPTIVASSANIASVVELSGGQYLITFSTPWLDLGYAWSGSTDNGPAGDAFLLMEDYTVARTTTTININAWQLTAGGGAIFHSPLITADPTTISLMFAR